MCECKASAVGVSCVGEPKFPIQSVTISLRIIVMDRAMIQAHSNYNGGDDLRLANMTGQDDSLVANTDTMGYDCYECHSLTTY